MSSVNFSEAVLSTLLAKPSSRTYSTHNTQIRVKGPHANPTKNQPSIGRIQNICGSDKMCTGDILYNYHYLKG